MNTKSNPIELNFPDEQTGQIGESSSEKIRMNIGKRLRQIRTELNFTQKEFGSSLGISWRTYQNYEIGSRQITSETLITLHQNHSIDPLWVLTGEGRSQTLEDKAILEVVINQIFETAERTGRKLEFHELAKIIVLAYFRLKSGDDLTDQSIVEWFELLS